MDGWVVALVELPILGLATYAWYRHRLDVRIAASSEALESARSELERYRGRREAQDEFLAERARRLEEREAQLAAQERTLETQQAALSEAEVEATRRLQAIAGMTREEAEARYLALLEPGFREAAERRAKRIEAEAMDEAGRRARSALLTVIERTCAKTVAEATLTVVTLPSEDLKGRLIGREGRNVRAFEQTTGTDLLMDESPDTVVLSSFDPIRRETARLTLHRLIAGGRIHPARIEEAHREAKEELARTIIDAGSKAAEAAGVEGLADSVVRALGRLRYRTSVGQNVLDHVVECARLAGDLAYEIGADPLPARRAALLHDIGKSLEGEQNGPHALTGANFLVANGESEEIGHAVAAHHGDVTPASEAAFLVRIADTLSAARPGARRDNLEQHVRRLAELEALALSFDGVERAYALEAGRELHLVVYPDRVDDEGIGRLAEAVAGRIEESLKYPGPIKVTVVRETRASQVAR